MTGGLASLHSQQIVNVIFLHKPGFGAVEIHQLERAAGFDHEVQRLVEVEGVLKLLRSWPLSSRRSPRSFT